MARILLIDGGERAEYVAEDGNYPVVLLRIGAEVYQVFKRGRKKAYYRVRATIIDARKQPGARRQVA